MILVNKNEGLPQAWGSTKGCVSTRVNCPSCYEKPWIQEGVLIVTLLVLSVHTHMCGSMCLCMHGDQGGGQVTLCLIPFIQGLPVNPEPDIFHLDWQPVSLTDPIVSSHPRTGYSHAWFLFVCLLYDHAQLSMRMLWSECGSLCLHSNHSHPRSHPFAPTPFKFIIAEV